MTVDAKFLVYRCIYVDCKEEMMDSGAMLEHFLECHANLYLRQCIEYAEICPFCGISTDKQMIRCKSCGKQIGGNIAVWSALEPLESNVQNLLSNARKRSNALELALTSLSRAYANLMSIMQDEMR